MLNACQDSGFHHREAIITCTFLWILSSNAGDAGSIPGLQTRIVCVAGQLSSQAARREKPMYHKERSCMLQLRPDVVAANQGWREGELEEGGEGYKLSVIR